MRVLLWCGLLRCSWLSLGFSYVVALDVGSFYVSGFSLVACLVAFFCFNGLSFSFVSLVGLNYLLLLFYQVVCFGLLPLSCIFRGGAARFSFFQGAFGLWFCP